MTYFPEWRLDMREQIIETIKRNRISTVEVADALGKKGVLPGISALNEGKFIVGEVFYTCTWGESNWPLHEQVQQVPDGHVVYVDTFECGNRAIFGDIVAKWLLLYQSTAGIVVSGLLRDIHRMKKEKYPIWCTGGTPLGCFNRDVTKTPEVKRYIEQQRERFDGAIMVADDSGCVIIEKSEQNAYIMERLEFLELQEDIWYFCTDTLKLSTYETICKKVYLDEPDLLPKQFNISLARHLKDDV